MTVMNGHQMGRRSRKPERLGKICSRVMPKVEPQTAGRQIQDVVPEFPKREHCPLPALFEATLRWSIQYVFEASEADIVFTNILR